MRTLTYSLILMAIIATFGVGWLLDRAYEYYHIDQATTDIDKVKLMEELGANFARTLDAMPQKQVFINQWQASAEQFELELVAKNDLPLPKDLLTKMQSGEALLLESTQYLTFYYYLEKSEQVFVLKTPVNKVVRPRDTVDYVFTMLFYSAVVLLFLLWASPLLLRLIVLKKSANAFGKGELNRRIKPSKLSYIGDIEQEFNHMAQRIEDLLNDVKLLSSAVSHDLRTPLARIQFGIDTLQEEHDPESRKKYEQKISDNVEEMTALVETLLQYARLDQSMLHMQKQSVNLTSLLANCVGHIRNAHMENEQNKDKIDITFEYTEDVFIKADSAYISMLINNLLNNAISYGNGQVSVTLVEQKDEAVFTISDNGQGINLSDQANLLKPFVRGENTKVKGHGFGLAIVKRIVQWHAGSLHFGKSDTLLGAKVSVRLPSERGACI